MLDLKPIRILVIPLPFIIAASVTLDGLVIQFLNYHLCGFSVERTWIPLYHISVTYLFLHLRYAFTVASNITIYTMTWVTLGIAGATKQVVGPEDASEFRVSRLKCEHIRRLNLIYSCLTFKGCGADCCWYWCLFLSIFPLWCG